MKNLPLLISTLVGSLILVVGIAFFFSAPEEQVSVADQTLVLGENIEVAVEKPTVAIFSDFQCPACAAVEKSILRGLKQEYKDRVNFVFRQFPLESIHPFARITAYASLAAGEQGQFWQYHDLLFENQEIWSALNSKEEVRAELIQYAIELEIDKDDFIEKMESEGIKEKVNADIADSYSLKINSTPTIYLDNNKTAPQDLQAQIELLLQDN
jgi:protein-disulfide isomerase